MSKKTLWVILGPLAASAVWARKRRPSPSTRADTKRRRRLNMIVVSLIIKEYRGRGRERLERRDGKGHLYRRDRPLTGGSWSPLRAQLGDLNAKLPADGPRCRTGSGELT